MTAEDVVLDGLFDLMTSDRKLEESKFSYAGNEFTITCLPSGLVQQKKPLVF